MQSLWDLWWLMLFMPWSFSGQFWMLPLSLNHKPLRFCYVLISLLFNFSSIIRSLNTGYLNKDWQDLGHNLGVGWDRICFSDKNTCEEVPWCFCLFIVSATTTLPSLSSVCRSPICLWTLRWLLMYFQTILNQHCSLTLLSIPMLGAHLTVWKSTTCSDHYKSKFFLLIFIKWLYPVGLICLLCRNVCVTNSLQILYVFLSIQCFSDSHLAFKICSKVFLKGSPLGTWLNLQ